MLYSSDINVFSPIICPCNPRSSTNLSNTVDEILSNYKRIIIWWAHLQPRDSFTIPIDTSMYTEDKRVQLIVSICVPKMVWLLHRLGQEFLRGSWQYLWQHKDRRPVRVFEPFVYGQSYFRNSIFMHPQTSWRSLRFFRLLGPRDFRILFNWRILR